MKIPLALLSCLSLNCLADDLDLGVAKLQWHSYGDLESSNGGADLRMEQWRLQSALCKPIQLADALYFMPALRYEYRDIEGPDAATGSYRGDLHMAELPLLFVYQPDGSAWSYNTRISPGISSDLESITSDDFFCDVRLGGNYKANDKLSINFGTAYTRMIGEPQLLPYLGFVYEMNDQWQFAVRGFTVEARCQLAESWIFRFIGEATGGYWNIDTPNSDYLSMQSYRAGVTIEHELRDDLWLVAGAGVVTANEVTWQTSSDRTLRENDFDDGAYLTLGLRWHDW
jgi:hypothetical protein